MNETIRAILDAIAPMLNQLSELPKASILGGILTLAGLALFAYVQRARTHTRRQTEEERLAALAAEKDAQIAVLAQRIDDQNTALNVVGERVLALEEYLELLGSKQQRMEEEQKDPRFYQHLVRLANRGMTAVEMSRRFGISTSEATLITAMNRRAG